MSTKCFLPLSYRQKLFHVPLILFLLMGAVVSASAAVITNSGASGTITGTTDADTITNEATGTVTGNIQGDDGDDTITNEGAVAGIIEGNADDDTITNSGSVAVIYGDDFAGTETGDDTIVNNGTVTAGIYGGDGNDSITNNDTTSSLYGGDGNDSITNTSTATGTVDAGAGNDTITNSGTVAGNLESASGNNTIVNTGTVNSSIITGDGDDHITNSSTVTGAIIVGNGDNTVINSGTTNSIEAGTGNDTITNSGTVAAILTNDGQDFIINNGTITGIIQGGNDNDIIKNYNTAANISGDEGNDTLFNYGTADVLQSGNGNDTIYNYGTVTNVLLGGDGDDTIYHYGTVANLVTEAGTDTVILGSGSAVTGVLINAEVIRALGPVTINQLDMTDLTDMTVKMPSASTPITVTTISTEPTGATLSVAITGGNWVNGTTVNVFSTGAVNGFTTENVIESSAVFDFAIALAQITMTQVGGFDDVLPDESQPIRAVATLFEANRNASGDLGDIISLLNFMTTEELVTAFKQMLPLGGVSQNRFTSMRMGSSAVLSRIRDILTQHRTPGQGLEFAASLTGTDLPSSRREQRAQAVDSLRFVNAMAAMLGSDTSSLDLYMDSVNRFNPDLAVNDFTSLDVAIPASGDLGPSMAYSLGNDLGVWARALGSVTEQYARDSEFGYNGLSYGVAAGMDYRFSESLLAGLFGVWTHSDLDYDDPGESSASGDQYQFGAYAALAVDDWFFELSGSWVLGSWYSDRRVILGATEYAAESSQNTIGFTLSALTGMDFYVGNLIVTPVLGMDYAYNYEYGYSEHGAGALNLEVDDEDRHSLQTIVGGELAYPIALGDAQDLTLTPALKAQWIHEYLGGEEITARFADMGSVSLDTDDPDRDTARLGVSLALAGDNGLSGFAAYESDISATAVDHALSIGLRYEF